MKKLTLVAFMCGLFVVNLLGQSSNTVISSDSENRIYFKMKDSIPLIMGLNEDPMNIDVKGIPFINAIAQKFRIKKLSKPFYAAKNYYALQRTFEIELANAQNADDVVRQLILSNMVAYAEKAPVLTFDHTPNDYGTSTQWYLTKIGAQAAWDYSTGSTAVKVAVVDEGVEITHPDLASNIWTNPGEIPNNNIDDDGNGYVDDVNGYDVADNDNNATPPTSSFNHGTLVSGVVSASTNNNIGIASIGYKVKIIPVKVAKVASSAAYGFQGIIYAVAAGARIINCSWSGTTKSSAGQDVVNYAINNGCLIVGSAGNAGNSTLVYPASYNGVISVAASESADKKASWSSYGDSVDVTAPGQGIYTTNVGGGYTYVNGTSFSSPLVAGLCGLMLSLNPNLSNADIEKCLKDNADNINAQNPSYIGKLGAGRINAANTMQCVGATLLRKPTADFIANYTTVTAGGSVVFTDKSLYTPTTWSWSFSGGTPAFYSGKKPPSITYNTPGTYNVSLTVTNTNGSNSITKTSYITVSTAGGCDITNSTFVNNPWTPVQYGASSTAPYNKDGWINGLNGLDGAKQKAQYFDASTSPYNKLTRVSVWVNIASSTDLSKTISFNVYDGTSGSPGALLGTTTKTLAECRKAYLNSKYLVVSFKPAITLPASKKFFIGFDYSNLDWGTSKDTLSIITNKVEQTIPSGIWEQKKSSGLWYQFNTIGSYWALNASMYMFPWLTDQPVIITGTVSQTSICQGSSVTLNATGSTFQDTLVWFTQGGSPAVSNNVIQNIFYNTPGTYAAWLYVIGGGCHELDSAGVLITVNATPNISITSSNGTTICPGSNTTLTASGATGSSYTWTPSTGLNTTSGATVIATPSTSTSFNVSGSSNGCLGSSAITINIDHPPTAIVSATPSNLTVCKNGSITFDASTSSDAASYSWTFVGGTPSTSTSVSPTVTYANSGNYTAKLTVTNSCGTDNSYSKSVNVNVCTGVKELYSSANINTIYNSSNKQLTITVNDNFNKREDVVIKLVNMLGQISYSQQLTLTGTQFVSVIDMSTIASGAYTIQFAGSSGVYNRKFIVD